MSELTLQRWEGDFRRDAKVDKLAVFRDHLRRLDLPGKPELMLEATIRVVQTCCVYAKLDGQSYPPFLAMQTYDPSLTNAAKYAFTFDLFGKAFARVLVPANIYVHNVGQPDLADLYNHAWDDLKVCGFHGLWITRVDWTALAGDELAQLEQCVANDLRFDYSEDELDLCFDESLTSGALFVMVQDREPDDDET